MPRLSSRRTAVLVSTTLCRLVVVVALTMGISGIVAAPAEAATFRTTTQSCVDGGGVTWQTKVVWGSTYVSRGKRRVAVDYAGWTNRLGVVPTDSRVTTYNGSGKLVRSLVKTATTDYRQGTSYGWRNPLNPLSGGARIVMTIGRDADGALDCTVTHLQSPAADPVLAAVGDMVCEHGATVTAKACQHKAVSDSILAARPAAFLALGDTQYSEGTLRLFQLAYEPSYGRLKRITSPVPGNHEYRTPGAAGYFDYFGTAAGLRSKGYYSQDIGEWHVVALNSEVDAGANGAQMAWLKRDLAAHPNRCTMAFMHEPRFSSGSHGDSPSMKPFFDALVAARVEVILAGHDHNYERFAPQTGAGIRSTSGATQIVVGTGGKTLNKTVKVTTNSILRSHANYGWLKMTLHPTSADIRFVPLGRANLFTDQQTISCR